MGSRLSSIPGLRVRVARGATSRAVAATGGVNVLVTVIGSIGGVLLARGLGATRRGELVVAVQWSAVITMLASVGLATATCYFVARARDQAKSIVGTAVRLGAGAGFLIAPIGGFVIAPAVARTHDVETALRVAFAVSPFVIVGGAYTGALQALHAQAWNAARVTQPVVYLVGVMAFGLLHHLTLLTAVAGYAASLVLQAAVAALLSRQTLGRLGRIDPQSARDLYSYGSKVALSTLPQMVNVHIDQLVLSVLPMVTAAGLANYAVAVSLASLALPVAVASGPIAFPLISAARFEDERRRIERHAIAFTGVAAGGMIVLVAVSAPIVVSVLFGRGYARAVTCVWMLAPGALCLALTWTLSDVLRGRNLPLRVSAAEGLTATVTIAGLAALVPIFGIYGAAMTSSIAYGVTASALARWLRQARRDGERLQ